MKRIKRMLSLLAVASLASTAMALPVTNGLVMNLDADNILSSSTGADGTITNWPDASAEGNDAVQTTAVNRPVLVKNNSDFKGHATVRFDGVNDWMTLNNDMVNVGSFTMFAVAKYNLINVSQYIVTGQSDGGNNRIRFAMNASSFAWRSGDSGEYRHTPNLGVNVFGTNSSAEFYLNGENVATYTNTSTETPGAFGIGSYGRGTKNFMNGDIATLIVYNRKLTAEEVDSVNSYLINKYTVSVTNPQPADGAVGFGFPEEDVMVTLQWDAAPDPLDSSMVDPEVVKHIVYLSGNNDDPNMYKIGEVPVSDYSNKTTSYGPIALDYDSTYSWKIVEALSDGNGGVLADDDPNNYVGQEWSFSTVYSVPVISSQPVSGRYDAGGTASFTTGFTSIYTVTIKWYDDSDTEIEPDSRISIISDDSSTTLEISDLASSDQGGYYCIITGAGETTSETAMIVFNKLLASYNFEQDFVDSAGTNDGTAVDIVNFVEGVVDDYAAETLDGGGYILMPSTAYPRTGLGNGMDLFTYSFWAKPSSTMTDFGRILGCFNDGTTTGFQIGIAANGSLNCYLRADGGAAALINTAADTVPDDQWSFITITYSGSALTAYLNGSMVATQNVPTLTNFADWQYPMTYMSKNSRGSMVEHYYGQLDDLKIYNYPMTELEVAGIYSDATGESVCVQSYKPSGVYDINNDCIVDILDIAEFAQNWLSCGMYPSCIK